MRRWGVVSSAALVVAANVFVLAGVALDRAGGVVQRVELTQRELPVAWSGDDNSGLAVRLFTWGPRSGAEAVIDKAKLVELGFDCSVPLEARSAPSHYQRQLAREALVVFEFGRPSQTDSPALVPVDAGGEFAALRAKYADQARYLIVPALVRARLQYKDSKPSAVVGWAQVLVSQIHVPQPYARTLAELRVKGSYRLTLCFGKRLEPWVCGCRP